VGGACGWVDVWALSQGRQRCMSAVPRCCSTTGCTHSPLGVRLVRGGGFVWGVRAGGWTCGLSFSSESSEQSGESARAETRAWAGALQGVCGAGASASYPDPLRTLPRTVCTHHDDAPLRSPPRAARRPRARTASPASRPRPATPNHNVSLHAGCIVAGFARLANRVFTSLLGCVHPRVRHRPSGERAHPRHHLQRRLEMRLRHGGERLAQRA
jgi:hypothetical protein